MAGRSVEGAEGPRCPRCARPLIERHCKYICPAHGVCFDCSDPFN